LEIESGDGRYREEEKVSSTRGEGDRSSSIVELHKNTNMGRELLLKKNWPNMGDQIALRKLSLVT
jgi:hypothetical protein